MKKPDWAFRSQLRKMPADVVLLLAVEELGHEVQHQAWRARLDDMSTRAAIFDEMADVLVELFTEFGEAQRAFEEEEIEQADRIARSSRPRRAVAVAKAAGRCGAVRQRSTSAVRLVCDRPYAHEGSHCATTAEGITCNWVVAEP
jgi:hypothetical protein